MIRFFVFLCLTAVISAERSKIHEEMTDDEIIYTFGPDNDEVPEYEVVPVAHGKHAENQEQKIIELTSFSRDMRFYLEPTDGYLAGVNTPVFRARHNPRMLNQVEYTPIPGAINGKYKIYQDPVNNAAVTVHYDPMGFPLINGVINLLNQEHSLVIRPLLSRFHDRFYNFHPFFQRFKRDASTHPDLEYTHHHVVYKIPNKKQAKVEDYEDSDDDFGYDSTEIVDDDDDDDDDNEVDSHGHRHLGSDEQLVGDHGHIDLIAMARGKRKRNMGNNVVPDIVYPQVLVIVDSNYFKLFKRNVPAIIEYLLAFWNGVDLRYRAYQKPEIRLNIAGIILAEDPSMTPYITKNRVHIRQFKNNKINVTEALRSKAQFMFPEVTKNKTDMTLTMQRLGFKFDFAITMTTLDMCQLPRYCADEETHEYTCNIKEVKSLCDTLGFAFYTGGCAFDDKYFEMEGVGIIEDTGSFFGIIPTAHEIGHLLGASHDAHNVHGCDWDDGYIMSYQMNLKNISFVWSNCSAESVKFFLKKEDRAQCMFDKPNTGNKVTRELPGKMFTRDELCHRAAGTRTCKANWYNEQCDKLYCEPTEETKRVHDCDVVRNHAVPEGTTCGWGRFCINGKCVSEADRRVQLQLATTSTEKVLTMEEQYMPEDNEDYNQ